jgi:exodeoxyribonuclease VII small subunit
VTDRAEAADPEAPQTYEQARAELEEVVRRLEAGVVPLEDSLALWERGEQLARQCQDWLDGARRRLAAVAEPLTASPDPKDSADSAEEEEP